MNNTAAHHQGAVEMFFCFQFWGSLMLSIFMSVVLPSCVVFI